MCLPQLSALLLLFSPAPVQEPANDPLAQDAAAVARRLPWPELRVEDLERWRDHVRPTSEELAFEAIAWIPNFAEGLRQADAQGKPLLLWAMNGHPLGCT